LLSGRRAACTVTERRPLLLVPTPMYPIGGPPPETELRTGKAAAKTIEGAKVEAGQRDAALLIELGRVEEIGDHIEADALKKLSRQVRDLIVCGGAMFWSSAAMRAETALAAV